MSVNQINYISAVIGFFVVNVLFLVFSGKAEGDRAERSLYLSLAGSTLHIHHWMLGLVGLIICLIIEQYFGRNLLLSFVKGLAFGSIFHGLIFYVDYFNIRKS